MLLQDWLVRENLTYGQLGGAISRTAEAVRRYANGNRIPDREAMAAIVSETGGQVTPNDFYGLTPHAPVDTAAQQAASPGNAAAISPSIGEAA